MDVSAVRYYCRNPRCRLKLKEPADNPHKAFCCKGCWGSFYLKRCIVCENDKPAESTAARVLCRRPRCRTNYRGNRSLYRFLGADAVRTANGSRNAIKSGIETRPFDDRPWRIAAGPVITANVYHCASQPLDPQTGVRAAGDRQKIRQELARKRRVGRAPQDVAAPSRWQPILPSDCRDLPALDIPAFLKRGRP